jgi:hypothetical protein
MLPLLALARGFRLATAARCRLVCFAVLVRIDVVAIGGEVLGVLAVCRTRWPVYGARAHMHAVSVAWQVARLGVSRGQGEVWAKARAVQAEACACRPRARGGGGSDTCAALSQHCVPYLQIGRRSKGAHTTSPPPRAPLAPLAPLAAAAVLGPPDAPDVPAAPAAPAAGARAARRAREMGESACATSCSSSSSSAALACADAATLAPALPPTAATSSSSSSSSSPPPPPLSAWATLELTVRAGTVTDELGLVPEAVSAMRSAICDAVVASASPLSSRSRTRRGLRTRRTREHRMGLRGRRVRDREGRDGARGPNSQVRRCAHKRMETPLALLVNSVPLT